MKPHLQRAIDGLRRIWCWRCTGGGKVRWGLTPAEAYQKWLRT